MLHFTNPTTMEVGLVTMEIWVETMDYVKQQCSITTIGLIVELE